MVKVTIAGGSGPVAREIIDALVATGKHNITILSRRDASNDDAIPGTTWYTVDYSNQSALVEALKGTHTLLSFVQIMHESGQQSQKQLIDAAVAAGVKRFAPSEYGSSGTAHMSWYAGKEIAREYLKKINANGKVLEYTLFQTGLFLDYLASPYQTAKHVAPLDIIFNYEKCKAIVIDGHEDVTITLTTAADASAVIAKAIGSDKEWPEISGIQGNRATLSQVIKLGEKIRGRPFTVEKVGIENLKAGDISMPWRFERSHSAIKEEEVQEMAKVVVIGFLLSSLEGGWDVSGELNQRFPDYEFTKMEDFLSQVWNGKP
ncbi:uncharacterized protein TrAtP1_009674 [Trichoderma atroviride]|uniref:NmrA-like domain-containing protein n=1 Tax=Hypocrea atroviridis (strain ATCC 20476 / IMI 206040) TaxID=452589 RepID=G9NKZ1_HYPAI|nr:uncharacterized protein TRIATDRAFT_262270 [Trichoderma atroviride IMI 206040]EHK48561.1 hypothetical protein TRIATDRAFT_262270 [Trichoderma atroviride IMI 206040]UKZ68650.1 hypothetical protein TrAtP1_009674 [Trichoderma atroviride]